MGPSFKHGILIDLICDSPELTAVCCSHTALGLVLAGTGLGDDTLTGARVAWGHNDTTVPTTNTGPATHIHQIRGLTKIRNPTLPSGRFSLGTT